MSRSKLRNQGRACPARLHPGQRSCADLGVCQSRPGCASPARQPIRHDTELLAEGGFWSAPGHIDGRHGADNPATDEPWRPLEIILALVAASAGAGALAGLLAAAWPRVASWLGGLV